MADNIGYTPGTGATIAADDVGGVLYQRLKLDYGDDGVSVPVTLLSPLPVGGVRRDSDSSPVSDGQPQPLHFNAIGRLKVSTLPGDIDAQVGAITANAQTVVLDTKRLGNACLMVNGTFAGINLAFEASLDGTTWFAIYGARSGANSVETTSGSLSATPAYAWNFGCASYSFVRVRATAFTSGSMTVTWKGGANSTDPAIPAQTIPGGNNNIGNVFLAAATNTVGGVFPRSVATAGGTTVRPIEAAASTNAISVKASAGNVIGWHLTNNAAYAVFVKFYNKASAPTVGTDATVWKIQIPAGATISMPDTSGYFFSTGIAVAITKLLADADTTVLVAGDVVGAIRYA